MKRRAPTGRQAVQPQMPLTALAHCRTQCCPACVGLPVPAIPAVPGVGAFTPPALLERGTAACARRTRLPCAPPPSPRRGPPGVQGLGVRRRIRQDREETWKSRRRAPAEQEWDRPPSVATGPGAEDGAPHPQRLHHQLALAPWACLAAVLPPGGVSRLGGLHRLTLTAHRTGGGQAARPRGAARARAGLAWAMCRHRAPGPRSHPRCLGAAKRGAP
jgi:hypothetical protein